MVINIRLIVFASGTSSGGGSGFEELVHAAKLGILKAEIISVVSNHKDGGVRQRADRLSIPFVHFSGAPWESYESLVKGAHADFALLSGWLKLVRGLDPRKTINIHPGPLPRFGGQGMHGHHVHEAVLSAFYRGEITHSEVSMHFVTEEYDQGPVFFRFPVRIQNGDTAETLGARANKIEHCWQPWVTNLVVHGDISWDGKNPKSLRVPEWYPFAQQLG